MSAFEPSPPAGLDRREAIKWMMAAAASIAVLERGNIFAGEAGPAPVAAKGYGTDPDLLKTYQPGELWPLTFTGPQRALAAILCDLIIPADERGPAASAVGVPAFIDEWISAPYAGHDADRRTVLGGFTWLDAEAQRRFGRGFVALEAGQRNAICDDICHLPDAKEGFETAARFFATFRNLAAGGYYTTPAGMKDIGYVGNVPLASFDGPPPEVLKRLGLA